jgi:SAM-dependent methyltransferase
MSSAGTFVSWEDAVSWLRRQPDMAQLVLECYYDDPPLGAAQRYFASEEWRAVRALLAGRHGAALDVGAGRGIASYALAREGFAVVSLEPDPSELVGAGAIRALARESGLPLEVVERTSEQLPFAAAEFDLVFARAALHHARDLAAACREFFRVLKPGGMLIAIREHVISRAADLPRFLEQHPLHRLYGGENALLLAQYRAAIEGAGFHGLSVLTPWSSPINYAPRDLEALKDELALRVTARLPPVRGMVRAGLGVDHRPGRLYSFVAQS